MAKITPCFKNRKSVIFDKLENGFGARTTELHIIRVNDSVIKFQEFLRLSIKSHFVYIASNNKAQAQKSKK
ncbi:restriction endonuclease subunit S domain-containing protein [Helicobacter anatolicus]|uniref:hypothetical protein n=1 Tax=Helicobacter anatolicus TaxID=2905874 RepID=UPI001E48B109|nr:hypothetical protein [Helicobacter anatolicus]MCE3038216.1 hypothetical protein [Helicobacter anatolicus]